MRNGLGQRRASIAPAIEPDAFGISDLGFADYGFRQPVGVTRLRVTDLSNTHDDYFSRNRQLKIANDARCDGDEHS